jgi:hypothetical protein
MTIKKNKSKIRQEIEAIYEQNELASLKANQSRARSITCGQTTGGLLEIVLRGETNSMWYVCNPVEAVEFMESIAAACGLEILKRPKQDFTSWRSWDLDQPNSVHWKGSAPWQISEKDRKQLAKVHNEKYGILPANINSIEKPKLEASSRRKKKVEESDEEE